MMIFDRAQLERQQARAHRLTQNDSTFLIDRTWVSLADRLMDIRRNFDRTLVLGTSTLPTPLASLQRDRKIGADLVCLPVPEHEILPQDLAPFDLVLSVFALHTLNDLPGMLVQIRRHLRPDATLIAALPGGETLHELRAALMQAELDVRGGCSPRVHPFVDKQQIGDLMQRTGYALPVVDSETTHIDYTSLTRLLHDLRHMGQGNAIAARDKRIPPRRFFERAEDIYRAQFAADKPYLPATFEVIHLIGWAPAPGQPQPKACGSATISLADVLES